MIRYEVNIELDENIKDEYLKWLKSHMDDMLKFKGFVSATIFKDSEDSNKISVQYDIETVDDMNAYLSDHATKMRKEAIDLFEGSFKASRRILLDA